MDLAEYLNTHQCEKDRQNIVSMTGSRGRYYIPSHEMQLFFDLFAKYTHTEDKHTGLVFVWPKCEKLPILIDIDLRMKEDTSIDNSIFIKFAEKIAAVLFKYTRSQFKVCVVRKMKNYQDTKMWRAHQSLPKGYK